MKDEALEQFVEESQRAGGPAFPMVFNGDKARMMITGMSLLDYFAGCEQKRNPCQHCPKPAGCDGAHLASCCYAQAKAMLAERERRMKEEKS
jgi:hypothetical protein